MKVYENENHDVVVTESELKGTWKVISKISTQLPGTETNQTATPVMSN